MYGSGFRGSVTGERIIKEPEFFDDLLYPEGHHLLPSLSAGADHIQHLIGNDVQVLHIRILDCFKLVVVDQVPEQTLEVGGQALFKIIQSIQLAGIRTLCRVNVEFDVGAKQGSEAFKDPSPCVLIGLLFEDLLQRQDTHNHSDLLSPGYPREVPGQPVLFKVI